jgi:hypothetical protein
VATLDRPRLLRRRGDNGPVEGQFDLHAAFRYVNLHLLKDGDFEKEITVYIGKRPLKVLPPMT